MSSLTFDPIIPRALWLTLAVLAAGLLVAYALASRGRIPRRRRAAILTLMAVAVMLPLVILLNPTWIEPVPPPAGKPLLTILVDSSASMAIRDAEEGDSRYRRGAQDRGRHEPAPERAVRPARAVGRRSNGAVRCRHAPHETARRVLHGSGTGRRAGVGRSTAGSGAAARERRDPQRGWWPDWPASECGESPRA